GSSGVGVAILGVAGAAALVTGWYFLSEPTKPSIANQVMKRPVTRRVARRPRVRRSSSLAARVLNKPKTIERLPQSLLEEEPEELPQHLLEEENTGTWRINWFNGDEKLARDRTVVRKPIEEAVEVAK